MSVKLSAPVGVGSVSCIDGTQVAVATDGTATVDALTATSLIGQGWVPQSPPPFSASFIRTLRDDFDQAVAAFPTSAQAGYPWVKKTVGSPTGVALVANAVGGVVGLALAATSEKEDAILYQADQLTYDCTKSVVYEARAAFSVLPTSGTKAVFGLMAAWIDGPNNNTFFVRFAADSNGTILAESFDGSTNVSVTTGVTVVANAYHTFRIDTSNAASVKFYIDNVPVATASTFVAPGTTHPLQAYASVYKASGTSVGTLLIDDLHIWSGR